MSFPDDIDWNLISTDVPQSDDEAPFENSTTSSSSEEEFEENHFEETTLKDKLKAWAIDFNVSMLALNNLLTLLSNWHDELPRCSATLFKTENLNVQPKIMQNGKFGYLGLRKMLRIPDNSSSLNDIFPLSVNIDGLPIFKSSTSSFWTILCQTRFLVRPVLVGIFYGTGKPEISAVLQDFCQEINDIQNSLSISISDNKSKMIRFICDAPARSFIKCTKGHSGFGSCDKCEVRGI